YANSKSTFCGLMNDDDDNHRRVIRTKDGRVVSARFDDDPRGAGVHHIHTSTGTVPVRYNPRTGKYQLFDKNWPGGNLDEIKDLLED
ncbi:hypothetical protein IJ596_06720, partial [bacterium]|nr:hypothetical protein [bacterium]